VVSDLQRRIGIHLIESGIVIFASLVTRNIRHDDPENTDRSGRVTIDRVLENPRFILILAVKYSAGAYMPSR